MTDNRKAPYKGKGKESESKSKPGGKRKAPYKGKDEYSKDYEAETSARGNNNPSWYIPDPVVMDQATRVSFDNFVGLPIDLNPFDSITGFPGGTLKPGAVMQIMLNPSPGFIGTSSQDPKTAAINQQGFRTYARLSSINAKNTNYLPNDITTMILAMGELISLIGVAQRAYGLLWTYNVRNRTMPTTLVDLAGVDCADLRKTAAQYVIRLNTLLVEANKIPFPSNIDYFEKCAQLYSTVYRDSESDMSELYVTLPRSTWLMEEDEILEGTKLSTQALYSAGDDYTPLTGSQLLDRIETKINQMLTSATYNYVYSDIINLATKDASVQLLRFTPIDIGYTVMPVYDKEFLLKINNAVIVGQPLATADQYNASSHTNENDVLPDPDALSLIYSPQWTSALPVLAMQKVFNFYNDTPTLDERISATRYINGGNVSRVPEGATTGIVGNYYTRTTFALGDHYITDISVYTDNLDTPDFHTVSSGTEVSEPLNGSILTRFSQHPYLYEFYTDVVSETIGLTGMIGDLDFFTTVDYSTLDKINKLALFALYDVKDVTKDR